MKTAPALLSLLLAAGLLAGCSRSDPPAKEITADAAAALPVEHALLTEAPNVPPPIARTFPARVVVDLEVREVMKHLADGVDYTFWTFGGSVPGLFIRVREGDYVELHLHNHPSSKMPHNIDLHAVSGPGGGAGASFTAPGHTSTFAFTAMNPGLYVYHCATAPVPMHVGNGMYGLILVEPRHGLPHVDREYYVMQGEFYTTGKFGEPGLQAFDPQKADDERPAYVVFNGAVGALSGAHALPVEVGQSVRIFFGDGGPNLSSSFHVIGQIFSTVYEEGGTAIAQHNVQTTVVPPGGATIVEFQARVPGNFAIVDHSLSRTFGKGALGIVAVTGTDHPGVFSGKLADLPYAGSAGEVLAAERGQAPAAAPSPSDLVPQDLPLTKEAQIVRGQRVFAGSCFACHQQNGQGIAGVFPPLADSDYIRTHRDRLAEIPLKGLTGEITVNGKTFNGVMPPQAFSDQQIADVLTYVTNTWGNQGPAVSAAEVARARSDRN